MFVKFKLYTYFLNTEQPAPDSELSIFFYQFRHHVYHVAIKHDLRHKKTCSSQYKYKNEDKCVINIK